MEVSIYGVEGFDFWWLIPMILVGLCFFLARGCCFGWRHRNEGRPKKMARDSSDSALDTLNRRYVCGEIDDEEYERKRKSITQAKKGEP